MPRVSIKTSKTGYTKTGKRRAPRPTILSLRTFPSVSRPIPTTVSVSQGGQSAFPNRQRAKLTYVQRGSFSGATGNGDYHLFRANSVYDPDYTTTGSQPTGFDEYAAIYYHYRVLRSKITLHCDNTTTAIPVIMWSQLASTAVSDVSPELPLQRGRAAYKTLGPAGANSTGVVTNVYDGFKFFGPTFIDRDHQASVGTNPSEDVYFQIAMGPLPTGSVTTSADWMVVIEYEVEFTEPKPLTST